MDEESIDFLGRAARTVSLPEASLTQTPVRDISAAARTLVERLRRLNVETLFRAQGLFSQLTGADIEAKLSFELEVRRIGQDIRSLQDQSRRAGALRHALRASREQILAGRDRLERIIAAGKTALSTSADADPFLKSRFERRLDNLVTLHASNELTCRQIEMADQSLSLVIDRVEDVATVLATLWQRDALAVAQSAKPVPKSSELAGAFIRSHDQLLQKLFFDAA